MTPQEHMATAVSIMGTLDERLPENRSIAIQEAQVHALIGLAAVHESLEHIKVALNKIESKTP